MDLQRKREVLRLVGSLTSSWGNQTWRAHGSHHPTAWSITSFCGEDEGGRSLCYDESQIRLATGVYIHSQVSPDPSLLLPNIAHHGSVVQCAGEVAGVLCGVGGEGVCWEMLPYITGGIQGNQWRVGPSAESEIGPHKQSLFLFPGIV